MAHYAQVNSDNNLVILTLIVQMFLQNNLKVQDNPILKYRINVFHVDPIFANILLSHTDKANYETFFSNNLCNVQSRIVPNFTIGSKAEISSFLTYPAFLNPNNFFQFEF